MNPVLILTHNCLDLTKRCVESIRKQDVPDIAMRILDNGSTDGTVPWFGELWKSGYNAGWSYYDFKSNLGVSYGWNHGLKEWFENNSAEHVLVINNDTVLPSFFYRTLLSYDADFITGVSVGSMEEIAVHGPRQELNPYLDFSAWLIRRKAWETVGPFNEDMKLYAGDNDWHVRAHRKGLKMGNCGCPFYHERSSTLNFAPPKEKRKIELQADADRETFKAIYGCMPWEPGYAALLSPDKFGIDAK